LLLAVHLADVRLAVAEPAAEKSTTVLATIGEEPITEADFQLFCAIRSIPREEQPPIRGKLLENLIERRLVQRFLRQRNIAPDPEELASQIARVEDLIRRRKDEPDTLLRRLGLTRAALEDELGLPLAWQAYVRMAVTDEQIAAHFSRHRTELDGTKLRASQIILKVRPGAPQKEIDERTARLSAVRREILAKKLTFAEAAEKYSEAPSKEKGGDVGWFPFRGKMAAPFCDAAFALKVGEISEPVVTPFGVHLIQVTGQQPGELTLEDVRAEVVQRISQELWKSTVASERSKAQVTLHVK
jgi:parvulin-like peptidyl-prolyl isomerase